MYLHNIKYFIRYFSPLKSYSTIKNMTNKPKVFVTRNDIPSDIIDILKERCEVSIWNQSGSIPSKDLINNIKDKNGLFCFLSDNINNDVLNNANKLKVIGTMSVGYDHININEVKKRNIRVGFTPDILTDATAELTLGLLLTTSRKLIEASQEVGNGGWKAWSPFWLCGTGLKNKTIGIVGFGRIGQQVARLIKPFNVNKIIYYNRSEKSNDIGAVRVNFDELLKNSDFIIITCALTEQTRGLFSTDAFDKMKSTAILINTSRGAVVNESALIHALKNNKIAAAGLDVMEIEPLPLDSPLLKLKNCVLLPHIGSATTETRREMAKLTVNNIICGLNNQTMPAEITLHI